MDNVDLKLGTEFSDQVQQMQQPKRIKISERSQKGILAKMSSTFKSVKSSVAPVVQENVSASVSVAVPEEGNNVRNVHPVKPTTTPVTPTVERAKESVLDNVTLRSIFDYASHTFSGLSGRMIREGDTMYNNTIAHTAAANVEPTVELGDISSPELSTTDSVAEPVNQVENSTLDVDTATVNVTEMQEVVNDAFTATPEVTPVVDNSKDEMNVPAKKVKKASYAKANVEKYNVPEKPVIELPRFTGSDIFDQSQSKVAEQKPRVEEEKPKEVAVEPVSNRDVPIVVAERDTTHTKGLEKKDAATETAVDTRFLFGTPAEEVTTTKNEISDSGPVVSDDKVEDEDIAQCLSKFVEAKQANVEAERRAKSAQEGYETSVVGFEEAKKKRKEEANNLLAQAESLKASTNAFEKEAHDFEVRTAQINAARQKIEADIRELNELSVSVSKHKQYQKAA